MKYDERVSQHKGKLSTGFYVVVALCLLIIGGASWFALSGLRDTETTPPTKAQENNMNGTEGSMNGAGNDNDSEQNSSGNNMNGGEYNDGSPSYDEGVTNQMPPSETTSETVKDQPYTEPQTPPAINFTMPLNGEILKNHSSTELQYSATYGDMRIHTGVDIAAKEGTNVSSVADGKVTAVEESSTFGKTVVIDYGNGISIKYSALDNIKVKSGDIVKMGDAIGTVSTVPSECADKPHLHLEVLKDSQSVDPFEALGLK